MSKEWTGLSRWVAQGGVVELEDLRKPFGGDRREHPSRVVNRDTGELVAVVFQGPDHDAFMANIYEGAAREPKDLPEDQQNAIGYSRGRWIGRTP